MESSRPPDAEPAFRDHFSKHSPDYGTFRPRYPRSLFAWLAAQADRHELAWDAGAGTGQASVSLAAWFDVVIATDASARQISEAESHPGVEYRVATAEASGIPDAVADLAVAAQALHWFDVPRFYAEVRRVLKPNGVVAVWTYGRQTTGLPSIDRVLEKFHDDIVGPWWPPERGLVETGYRTLPFPFNEIEPPAFEMTAAWRLDELLGYVGTWSATIRLRAATGTDPILTLRAGLETAWGGSEVRRDVRWPLSVRAGRCT